jgi:hypothetical protein
MSGVPPEPAATVTTARRAVTRILGDLPADEACQFVEGGACPSASRNRCPRRLMAAPQRSPPSGSNAECPDQASTEVSEYRARISRRSPSSNAGSPRVTEHRWRHLRCARGSARWPNGLHAQAAQPFTFRPRRTPTPVRSRRQASIEGAAPTWSVGTRRLRTRRPAMPDANVPRLRARVHAGAELHGAATSPRRRPALAATVRSRCCGCR